MLSPGEAETTLSHLDPSYLEVAAGRVGRGDAAQLHPQVSDQPPVKLKISSTVKTSGHHPQIQAAAANCQAGAVPRSLST